MDKKEKTQEIPLKTMEGIFIFADIPFPEKGIKKALREAGRRDDLSENLKFGFIMAKCIVSLYTIEILLKYAHQQIDKRAGGELKTKRGHNICKLFADLPEKERIKIESLYQERAKEIVRENRAEKVTPLKSLLDFLGKNPITDVRYFWDKPNGKGLAYQHNNMEAFSFAVAIGVCGYPAPQKP